MIRQEGEIVARRTRHPTSGDVASVDASERDAGRGRPVHRLLGLPRPADRQELEAGFEDWSHWLPCDRAIAVPCARIDAGHALHTQSIARKAGWQWRIPLQHRTGNGHVYCSASHQRGRGGGDPARQPRRRAAGRAAHDALHHRPAAQVLGPQLRRARACRPASSSRWNRPASISSRRRSRGCSNCFPAARSASSTRDDYNRQSAFEMERIRDFIILHYHANQRDGEPFWDELPRHGDPGHAAARRSTCSERRAGSSRA